MTAQSIVTGRSATRGERCSRCQRPAVSVFLVDDRTYGACEPHIIEVHAMAEKSLTPDLYQRGSKTGRVNATHIKPGTRILATRDLAPPLTVASRKTGALIATVHGKRMGGGFRCYIIVTDLGDIVIPAAQAMWTLEA